MKLKDQVEWCLKNIPDTRDSDIKLTLNIWHRFYPNSLKQIDGVYYVKAKDLYDLPREDNVKRIRAKFNESGEYLTDKPQIRKQRKQKEIEWLYDLGYIKWKNYNISIKRAIQPLCGLPIRIGFIVRATIAVRFGELHRT